ncbi:Putative Glutamine amidotransferase [Morus notabilis]|uniref:Putative Glutamine amidotransferase n=1 Tax=Morus notabilis TaxID=981085 RepID=W9RDD9_9ROSA|nr:uncharacterized protein LOC21394778 [Morus notabilis]EXB83232.1 Putative Glutamine amidotransferase [Morus notabilis]
MCSSKPKTLLGTNTITSAEPKINGRPVLQPTCNRVSSLERRMSLKKTTPKSPTSPPLALPIQNGACKTKPSTLSPPVSPKLPSPRPPAIKRGKDPNYELNSSAEKVLTPRCIIKSTSSIKKSKKCGGAGVVAETLKNSSSLIVEAPGSIAAARREQVAIMQEQRKIRIAHYGRTKSAKFEGKVVAPMLDSSVGKEQKRCSYITPNSDPIYVAYHDEEWGVPVHDDKLLFELLVLTGAQVGSDWTSVLKKREIFRNAFSGFDAEAVSKYNEKKITSIGADYGIELSLIRGAVDNANRILEIKKEFGSLNKYLWGFVNNKLISTQYKSCQKIPVKTSKSESISKDMVRRGFRFVGPTVIYSFMQAAGLTNDHLITCPRHLQCLALASQLPSVAPAL